MNLEVAVNVISNFKQEDLHTSDKLDFMVNSIKFVIQTASECRSTEISKRSSQMFSIFAQFTPNVVSLLQSDVIALEPYAPLLDDKFNILVPHLFNLFQFVMHNYVFFRKQSETTVVFQFQNLFQYVLDQISVYDNNTMKYSTFIQSGGMRVFGAQKFKFKPNSSYFQALVGFLISLATLHSQYHEVLLRPVYQLVVLFDSVEQQLMTKGVKHSVLLQQFNALGFNQILNLKETVELLLQFENKNLEEYKLLSKISDLVDQYWSSTAVNQLRTAEEHFIKQFNVTMGINETGVNMFQTKVGVEIQNEEIVINRLKEILLKFKYENVLEIIDQLFLHEIELYLFQKYKTQKQIVIQEDDVQIVICRALRLLPQKWAQQIVESFQGMSQRIAYYKNKDELTQSLENYFLNNKLSSNDVIAAQLLNLEELIDYSENVRLQVLLYLSKYQKSIADAQSLTLLEPSEFNIVFGRLQQPVQLILDLKSLEQTENLIKCTSTAVSKTSMFEINTDLPLMFLFYLFYKEYNMIEKNLEIILLLIEEIIQFTTSFINDDIVMFLLKNKPDLLKQAIFTSLTKSEQQLSIVTTSIDRLKKELETPRQLFEDVNINIQQEVAIIEQRKGTLIKYQQDLKLQKEIFIGYKDFKFMQDTFNWKADNQLFKTLKFGKYTVRETVFKQKEPKEAVNIIKGFGCWSQMEMQEFDRIE
ncbi:Conserved_hypothetical protein [Hexamita inflata]|uniref:Uncharacterized protein n=1 Tax=Hexamita inflata TaxID=28002 RepID=A0AA86QG01_9EUKA|nr:Conserved hypothetical protein [Hexamita inflata]